MTEWLKISSEKLESLSLKRGYLLILVTLERQWEVYKKASREYEWGREDIFRDILDKCWRVIIQGEHMDKDIWNQCNENHPENIGEDEDSEISGFCMTIVDNITALVELLMSQEVVDKAFMMCNFDFLDAFLYQYYDLPLNSREIVEEHELFQKELARQERDYQMVKDTSDMEQIKIWYKSLEEESVLDNYWFNENF